MAKTKKEDKQRSKREGLELRLGQMAYQIGKKSVLLNQQNQELQAMQKKANDLATEIEKLDE